MKSKRKQHDNDDGRVIMNMNVEGMPWHIKTEKIEDISQTTNYQVGQLTRIQSRMYTWYAVLYGLGIAAVFSVTWILLTLFLTQIW